MRHIILGLTLLFFLSTCNDKKTNVCDFVDCIIGPVFYLQLLDNGQPYITDNLSIVDQDQNMIYASPEAGSQLYFVNSESKSTDLNIVVDDSLSYDLKLEYEILRETECCGPVYDILNPQSDSTNVSRDSIDTFPNIVIALELK